MSNIIDKYLAACALLSFWILSLILIAILSGAKDLKDIYAEPEEIQCEAGESK